MNIIRADLSHLEELAVLFDLYRQFYECPPDLNAARAYLRARIEADDNMIWAAADDDGRLLGFTQVYPSFCSLALKPIYVLYDLYVAEDARKTGAGTALMNAVAAEGRKNDIAFIILETANDNTTAQSVYERLGYKRDEVFYTYTLTLNER